MEDLKNFQSSLFDTAAKRRLVGYYSWTHWQDRGVAKMWIIVWIIQEIFKMLNQHAAGHSHVTSQALSFPLPSDTGGMLSRSTRMPSRKNGPPSFCGTHGYSEKRFSKSSRVFFSTLSAGIESMEFKSHVRTVSLLNSGGEWESSTSSESEMQVRTVSQKFSHLQWRRLSK